ncbi:MAG: SagB/ThcOx family dehydrogenase [Calothrix sp. C42_A2020_038]|nr:SagB/ThcOx family dehydrogenase [Calothrix sp. C42_A2020_038]
MIVRFANDVKIITNGNDGIIERSNRAKLILPGVGAQLQTLAVLLQTPRSSVWLSETLSRTHPGSTGAELVNKLLDEEVLIPWTLSSRLVDLHKETIDVKDYPTISPGYETARLLREYSGKATQKLPPPQLANVNLEQVLLKRRSVRQFSGQAVTKVNLSTILAMGAGLGGNKFDEPLAALVLGGPVAKRTYPSGGGLYPIELLVYPLQVETINSGFYYYQVLSHRMVSVSPSLPKDVLVELLNEHPIQEASILLLLFIDFARLSLGKYGEKSYRLALIEAGHIAQNVLLIASGLGLKSLPICGFNDEQLSHAAGLNFPYEVIIYVLAIGGAT